MTITETDYCPMTGDRPADDGGRPAPEFAWSEARRRARVAALEFSASAGREENGGRPAGHDAQSAGSRGPADQRTEADETGV